MNIIKVKITGSNYWYSSPKYLGRIYEVTKSGDKYYLSREYDNGAVDTYNFISTCDAVEISYDIAEYIVDSVIASVRDSLISSVKELIEKGIWDGESK